MKYLILLMSMASVCVQADCSDRVADTQMRIQSITGELDREQSIRISALLLELCNEREPGSSVIKSSDRRVVTTQGMKQRPISTKPNIGIPVIVDVEVDRPRRDRRREEQE